METDMTDGEILRSVGLGTLLDNVDNNLIGRWVLKAMAQARQNERAAVERELAPTQCDCVTETHADGRKETRCGSAQMMRSNA